MMLTLNDRVAYSSTFIRNAQAVSLPGIEPSHKQIVEKRRGTVVATAYPLVMIKWDGEENPERIQSHNLARVRIDGVVIDL